MAAISYFPPSTDEDLRHFITLPNLQRLPSHILHQDWHLLLYKIALFIWGSDQITPIDQGRWEQHYGKKADLQASKWIREWPSALRFLADRWEEIGLAQDGNVRVNATRPPPRSRGPKCCIKKEGNQEKFVPIDQYGMEQQEIGETPLPVEQRPSDEVSQEQSTEGGGRNEVSAEQSDEEDVPKGDPARPLRRQGRRTVNPGNDAARPRPAMAQSRSGNARHIHFSPVQLARHLEEMENQWHGRAGEGRRRQETERKWRAAAERANRRRQEEDSSAPSTSSEENKQRERDETIATLEGHGRRIVHPDGFTEFVYNEGAGPGNVRGSRQIYGWI